MIALVVAGKLTRQSHTASVSASADRTVWQIPAQNASFFESQTAVKRKTNQGGGNHFWQATAPTTVHATSLE
ncbi:hypothetical protein DNI29_15520 [Hymenobacter sediminis]|uniref:hypothetical protein n=1 Tax=Hymenobacter sediminis TaxID=2218621 RepID=UPI000DA64825|nr:hypothetical protein [Hymenobacter sediminis]RPD46404.1 hypothetical protein DNI29_15520 [Hymenobacter sediminis]